MRYSICKYTLREDVAAVVCVFGGHTKQCDSMVYNRSDKFSINLEILNPFFPIAQT